jgi:hypothetical protein
MNASVIQVMYVGLATDARTGFATADESAGPSIDATSDLLGLEGRRLAERG